VSRSRFTRRQRLVLSLMATAVGLVFGLLAYAVFTTLRTPLATDQAASPAVTAYSPLITPTTVTATVPVTPTSPAPTPTATQRPPLSPVQSARVVNEVGRIVAGVRDLPPVEQIPVTFPTTHEIAIALLQRYQEEQPQEALVFYAALGLVPPLDPLPLPDVTAQAARISTLYLTDDHQIYVVTGRGPTTDDDELALAHALAHALQDRQFDLGALTPCRQTADAELALRALVEGDAVLTAGMYAGLESDPEMMARLARMAADAEEPTYAPLVGEPAFEQLRLFPYQEGARMVAALYEEGGWEAVNRAYARPPCSTEQVLHPERYLEGEPVQEMAMPDLLPALGEGWSQVRRDTLGELLIGLHLAAHLEDDVAAWDAADGWAGDAFALWADEEGRQVLAWRIAWDNRDEAEAFVQTYTLLVPRFRTPPLLAATPPSGLPGRFWEGEAGAAYLARAGRVVTVVWGPDAETVMAVAGALP